MTVFKVAHVKTAAASTDENSAECVMSTVHGRSAHIHLQFIIDAGDACACELE